MLFFVSGRNSPIIVSARRGLCRVDVLYDFLPGAPPLKRRFFYFLQDSFLMEFRADGLPVQLVVGGAVQRGEGERGTIYVVFGQSRIDSI